MVEALARMTKGGNETKAGAIRCILAGGTWRQARLASAGLAEEAGCPRCGLEAETTLHRWWRCPALDATHHQAQVGDLVQLGAARDFQPRCYWQNGMEAWTDGAASRPGAPSCGELGGA